MIYGVSQNEVFESPASKLQRGFLKMQIPRGGGGAGNPKPTDSGISGVVPGNLHFKFTR